MKLIILFALSISVFFSFLNAESLFGHNEEQLKAHWSMYKVNNGMHKLSALEEITRFKLFKDNFAKVLEHNQNADEHKIGYRVSINRFSALSSQEYKRKLGLRSFRKPNVTLESSKQRIWNHFLRDTPEVPESISYVSKLTPVKNQYSCGGCWAFAAIGVAEALYAISNNKSKKFSEQQLIDCTIDNSFENFGCNGGYPSNAFTYLQSNGVVEDIFYPYRAAQSKCFENNNNYKPRMKITGHGEIPFGNEDYMKTIVGTVGPVAIGVDASQWGFAHYSSGIYSDSGCSQYKVNHAVMAVGYGSENGKPYWIIRNSWGPNWGLSGYMKLARNSNNMCGVSSMSSYAYL